MCRFSSRHTHTNEGVEVKYKRYMQNYDIAKADIIPLVFDTYGGYAKVTYDFLKARADAIGNGDAKLAEQILRLLRDRIAVALHTGHGRVINSIRAKNRRAQTALPSREARC